MSNNPPYSSVEFTKEQHDFIVKNCDTNLVQGLEVLQMEGMSRDGLEKVVDLMERFKEIKALLNKGVI